MSDTPAVYDYSFSANVANSTPFTVENKAISQLLRLALCGRCVSTGTEHEFGKFWSELTLAGVSLHEVERQPHFDPEPCSCPVDMVLFSRQRDHGDRDADAHA